MAFTVREMEVLLFCFHEEISEVKVISTIKSGDVHFSQEVKVILNKPLLREKVRWNYGKNRQRKRYGKI